jgi:hypothetical protein
LLVDNLGVDAPILYHGRRVSFQNNGLVVIKGEAQGKEMARDFGLGK